MTVPNLRTARLRAREALAATEHAGRALKTLREVLVDLERAASEYQTASATKLVAKLRGPGAPTLCREAADAIETLALARDRAESVATSFAAMGVDPRAQKELAEELHELRVLCSDVRAYLDILCRTGQVGPCVELRDRLAKVIP